MHSTSKKKKKTTRCCVRLQRSLYTPPSSTRYSTVPLVSATIPGLRVQHLDFRPKQKNKNLSSSFYASTSTRNKMLEETVTICESIGSGGSAQVYRGTLAKSQTSVAVKIVKREPSTERGRKIISRTKNESLIMSELSHKHICKLLGEMENELNIFLVLQYASGGDLLDRLNSQGPLPEKTARKVFRQVLSAINYLHGKGVIHRDLKPGTHVLPIPPTFCTSLSSCPRLSSSFRFAFVLFSRFIFLFSFSFFFCNFSK